MRISDWSSDVCSSDLDGKVGSDAEVRGRMMLRAQKDGDKQTEEVLTSLQEMAEIEQRMKLYLTPYTQLMDPETSRIYPSVSSKLATLRLAASFPTPMQLAKQDRKSYRLDSSHSSTSCMPSYACNQKHKQQ